MCCSPGSRATPFTILEAREGSHVYDARKGPVQRQERQGVLLPPQGPRNVVGCLSSPTGPGCHPRPVPLCLESSSACLAPIPSLPRSHALMVVLANPTGRAGSAMSEAHASLPTA